MFQCLGAWLRRIESGALAMEFSFPTLKLRVPLKGTNFSVENDYWWPCSGKALVTLKTKTSLTPGLVLQNMRSEIYAASIFRTFGMNPNVGRRNHAWRRYLLCRKLWMFLKTSTSQSKINSAFHADITFQILTKVSSYQLTKYRIHLQQMHWYNWIGCFVVQWIWWTPEIALNKVFTYITDVGFTRSNWYVNVDHVWKNKLITRFNWNP